MTHEHGHEHEHGQGHDEDGGCVAAAAALRSRHCIAIVAALVVGSMYYVMMETSISKESSCSYAATPMTDYLAFLWGFIVVWCGWKVHGNPILTFLGATVIVEHLWQLKNKGKGIPSLRA
jgi:hypothetical protein